MKSSTPIKLLLAPLLVAAALLIPAAPPALAQGYPAFNIDSWSTDKESLNAGDTFLLTITFSNVGTFGANEVLVEVAENNTFIGVGTSPRYEHLGIGAQVTTSFQVGIADNLDSGYYNLPIAFYYHHAALGGERSSYVRNIGVYVNGDTSDVSVAPRLLIQGASATPGEAGEVLVDLTLSNIGTTTATEVIVNLDSSEVLSPAQGTSSATVVQTAIGVKGQASVTIPLIVIADPGGQVKQSFTIEYSDYNGGSYSETQTVSLLLSGAGQAPHLIIPSFAVSPQPVTPGTDLRLALDVVNLGSSPAREVVIRLGEDVASLSPLAPVGSSNVLYVGEIPAQSQVQVSFDLRVDGGASAGLVPIDVLVSYDNLYGIETDETFSISLQIESAPQFYISLFQDLPETITVGDSFDLPIQVVNIGVNTVNVSTINVESDILNISDGLIYLGPLDGSTSGSILAHAEAAQAGTATVVVEINYLDDFQQPQIYTHRLTFEIEEAAGTTLPGTSSENGDGGIVTFEAEGFSAGNTRPSPDEGTMTPGQRILRAILGFFGLATSAGGGLVINTGG